MTDHDRHQGDWDQDVLFNGVPSSADRTPGRDAEPADRSSRQAAERAAERADQSGWQAQTTAFVDPMIVPMTGRAESATPFDPTTVPRTGPAESFPPGADGHYGTVAADRFTPDSGTASGRASGVGGFEPGAASGPGHYGGPPPEWAPAGPDARGYGDAAPDLLQPVPDVKGYGKLPVIVAALAVLLIAGAAGGVVLLRSSDRTDASGPVTEPTPQVTPTETVATEVTPTETATTGFTPGETPTGYPSTEATMTADPQEEALAQLDAIRQQDLGTVTFDGRLVAQIASKYPGVSDPYQTAADGSHTFQVSDILAEHQRLRAEHGDTGHPVILLKSTDYGKRQLINGQALWVTFVIGDFPDKKSVTAWCASHFGNLSAAELKNHCDARNLRPAS